MKFYFYVLTQHNIRTGEAIGKTCGVFCAENDEEAQSKLFPQIPDSASLEIFREFDPAEGESFTVYKSSF